VDLEVIMRPERIRTNEEWRGILTPQQYRVTVEGADDPDFDNPFWDHFEPGRYLCVRCDRALFDAADKYEANTGAPTFAKPIDNNVAPIHDPRPGHGDEQLVCVGCGSKLGHLHNDGPPPLGLRYCTNSTAFRFVGGD
jgi:peptide-methionine (R)-S-oxide reductase